MVAESRISVDDLIQPIFIKENLTGHESIDSMPGINRLGSNVIEEEIKNGILPDPSQVDPITGEPLPQEGGDLGEVPQDDNLDAQGQVTDAEYQKDTKSAEI